MPGRIDPNKGPIVGPGRISISRAFGGRADEKGEPIGFEIVDDVSRTLVCRFDMSLEDFAKTVTGQGELPGTLTIYVGAPWGKRCEHKTAYVQIPVHTSYKLGLDDTGADRPKWNKHLTEALKMHEVDGWIANRRDAENHHRRLRWAAGQLFSSHSNIGKAIEGGPFARPERNREYYHIGFHRYVDPQTGQPAQDGRS